MTFGELKEDDQFIVKPNLMDDVVNLIRKITSNLGNAIIKVKSEWKITRVSDDTEVIKIDTERIRPH